MTLCERLAIDFPLLQAPMAGVQNWQLAVAVSEAGGLGAIPCGMLAPDQIVEHIEQFRRRSQRSYNLNFFCHTMPAADNALLQHWQQQMTPYYNQLEVEPPGFDGALRRPFDDDIADLLEPYRPAVISFHFGLPAAELLQRVKSWGTTVLSSATTLEEGLWLQQHGADVVIAQGIEAGGHRAVFLQGDDWPALLQQQPGCAELVTQLSRQLDIPVIAAGGIASHADVRRMLAAGAAGVQLGTSYLLCDEANTSELHRQALQDEQRQTAVTTLFSGRPARGIVNRVMTELGCMPSPLPPFPYASLALAPLRSAAEARQRDDFSPLWAGENRSGCRAISAAQLTRQLWFGE